MRDVAFFPRHKHGDECADDACVYGPTSHFFHSRQGGLHLHFAFGGNGCHFLSLGNALALIHHSAARLLVGLHGFDVCAVVVVGIAGYIVLLALLQSAEPMPGAMTMRTESMMHTQVDMYLNGMRWLAYTAVSE